MAKPIGILGGTFDPVHNGHLRLAIECLEQLQLEEVRLVPLYTPPHRHEPAANPDQRLDMLKIAISDVPHLVVDNFELQRKETSYTIETVANLRNSYGDIPICLLMGFDAFTTLNTWREWESLFDYVHIVVASRSSEKNRDCNNELSEIIKLRSAKEISNLHETVSGKIFYIKLPLLDISSSQIRNHISAGLNVDCLLPEKVINYIKSNKLYLSN